MELIGLKEKTIKNKSKKTNYLITIKYSHLVGHRDELQEDDYKSFEFHPRLKYHQHKNLGISWHSTCSHLAHLGKINHKDKDLSFYKDVITEYSHHKKVNKLTISSIPQAGAGAGTNFGHFLLFRYTTHFKFKGHFSLLFLSSSSFCQMISRAIRRPATRLSIELAHPHQRRVQAGHHQAEKLKTRNRSLRTHLEAVLVAHKITVFSSATTPFQLIPFPNSPP
jgi:hypothetical protein